MSVLLAYMYVYLMNAVPVRRLWGQKMVLDPLELELQAVVRCYVDVRNLTLVLWKSLIAEPSLQLLFSVWL